MSVIIKELISSQKNLADKIRDGDLAAEKLLTALRSSLSSCRPALQVSAQINPQIQQLLETLDRFLPLAESEIQLNKTPDYQAIRSNRIAINAAARQVQDRISTENAAEAVLQLNRLKQLIVNHTPQLSRSLAGQTFLAEANAKSAEFQGQITALQSFDKLKHIVFDFRGVKGRLDHHLQAGDQKSASRAFSELETKLSSWEPALNQSECGTTYLQKTRQHLQDAAARIDQLTRFQSAQPALQQASLHLKTVKSTLKSLTSVLDRQSRVANLWGQVVNAASPLQNPDLQEFPEICMFWGDYESVETQIRGMLGEAAFTALTQEGKVPKPKYHGAMKGLLSALNSGMGEKVLTKTVSATFKSLSSSSGSFDSPMSAGVSEVSPTGSSPTIRAASSPTIQTVRRPDATAQVQQSLALVEYDGIKTKLTLKSNTVEDLVADVSVQLRAISCTIEYEDADFPGHFLPVEHLPQPIPSKLILRVFPHTQPVVDPNPSAGVGLGQLNFSIPFAELKFFAQIGTGSFGQVHRGVWRGQDVAIKESIALSDATRTEFLGEVQLMCNLRPHKNIVQVLGVSVKENRFYLVMELMKTSLERISVDPAFRRRIQDEPSIANNYALQIAAGMSHLEAEGVCHRDLACRNVLVDDAGTIKISDFGLSRKTEGPEAAGATQSNIGPIRWMAPENFLRVYSSKSDVWSYACTIYELVTGKPPHMQLDLLQCALMIRFVI
eukprot:TRINITY_DN1441_c0_g1_i3.p1 TRINITY_DN1441_c0_g1~~TRINITY_DN1441_c0_g1_i3.p1  ORF type:complete len:732 (+),score=74.76 TRINITY_DN1441_c0_g1_i3:25-2196(+)